MTKPWVGYRIPSNSATLRRMAESRERRMICGRTSQDGWDRPSGRGGNLGPQRSKASQPCVDRFPAVAAPPPRWDSWGGGGGKSRVALSSPRQGVLTDTYSGVAALRKIPTPQLTLAIHPNLVLLGFSLRLNFPPPFGAPEHEGAKTPSGGAKHTKNQPSKDHFESVHCSFCSQATCPTPSTISCRETRQFLLLSSFSTLSENEKNPQRNHRTSRENHPILGEFRIPVLDSSKLGFWISKLKPWF